MKAEALSDAEASPSSTCRTSCATSGAPACSRAQRGYEGGYRLSRPAAAISVSDVLEAVASPLTEPYVWSGSVWDALETSTRDLLGSTTVADLVVG